MNWGLLARVALRLIALIAVSLGYVEEGVAEMIVTNSDIIAIASLVLSEGYFLISKWWNKWT